ncbi:uncharacterized protein LOC142219657 [Haematobia irritans]|uniref:uncharacterized protein LOC142219657 n=1 Tax=Haematobia irritans TaxID=7368 RepID=UPI003F50BC62
MVSYNLQTLLALATVLIVYESSLSPLSTHAMASEVTATSLKQTEMDGSHHEYPINKASMSRRMMTSMESFQRLARHSSNQGQQHQYQYQHQHQHENSNAEANKAGEHQSAAEVNAGDSVKRSYSSDASGGHGLSSSTLNGLVSLSGLQHIRNTGGSSPSAPSGYGYGSSSSSSSHPTSNLYTEAKPIYEEHQEHGYAAQSSSGSSSSGNGEATNTGLHSAIYNLQAAGTHNAGLLGAALTAGTTNNGGSNGFRPSWNFGKLSTSFTASPSSSLSSSSTPYHYYGANQGIGGTGPSTHTYGGGYGSDFGASNSVDSYGSSGNNDKISEGNFLHHYQSASGYNELTHQQPASQYQYPAYQPHYGGSSQHDSYNSYNSVEQAAESSSSYAEEHSEHGDYMPSGPSSSASGSGGVGLESHHEEKQPDVINYHPYPVVKKLHVPVHEPVQIPVSHAVIVPIKKPVPIHIPITKNVQVPVEKDLKIPVERIVPYPVEKHIPVPVEKRVPYEVIKYVPIKVAKPFPVKVPVFKTVLHKVKGWW